MFEKIGIAQGNIRPKTTMLIERLVDKKIKLDGHQQNQIEKFLAHLNRQGQAMTTKYRKQMVEQCSSIKGTERTIDKEYLQSMIMIKQKSKNCRINLSNIHDIVFNQFTVSQNQLLGQKGVNLTFKLHKQIIQFQLETLDSGNMMTSLGP